MTQSVNRYITLKLGYKVNRRHLDLSQTWICVAYYTGHDIGDSH